MKRPTIILIIVMGLAVRAFSQGKLEPDLAALVEAERAFARAGVEKGVAASFYEYFADDGVNFTPQPAITRQVLKDRVSAPRPPVTLDWAPMTGDIAASGELGYNTGPYWLTDDRDNNKLLRQGYFFSVWKKQPDGQWRVVLDMGIETPAPDVSPRQTTYKRMPQPASRVPKSNTNAEAERAALQALDGGMGESSGGAVSLKAWLAQFDDQARLHRSGHQPVTGKTAIAEFINRQPAQIVWQPLKTEVARSNDLGYSYGSYEMKSDSGQVIEKGYYSRVWKRDTEGRWRIVLDCANAER